MSDIDNMPLWVAYFDTSNEEHFLHEDDFFYVRARCIQEAIMQFLCFCERTNCVCGDEFICKKVGD